MFLEAKQKLDNMLKTKFAIFANAVFSSNLYIFGGIIRDTIIGKENIDLDLFILSDSKKEVFDFIKKHNLEFKTNSFGNPKISYNGINIDFCSIKNFGEVVFFNTDGLFYNFSTGKFVLTNEFKNFLKSGKVEIVNTKEVHPSKDRINERKAKVELFANYILKPQNLKTIKTEIENKHLFEKSPNKERCF